MIALFRSDIYKETVMAKAYNKEKHFYFKITIRYVADKKTCDQRVTGGILTLSEKF